jgi:hypothetical protein
VRWVLCDPFTSLYNYATLSGLPEVRMPDAFAPYIIRTYRGLWDNTGPIFNWGLYKTDNFAQGTNVFAFTAIQHSRGECYAFIYQWSIYGAGGQITPVPSPADPFFSSVYIDNCANITFAVGSAAGRCGTLATVFRR